MGHAADRCAAVDVAQLVVDDPRRKRRRRWKPEPHDNTQLTIRHVCTRKILSASKPVTGHREDCIWVGITGEDRFDDTFKLIQVEGPIRGYTKEPDIDTLVAVLLI